MSKLALVTGASSGIGRAFARGLHEELKPEGLRFQVVCSGVVATEFHTRQGWTSVQCPACPQRTWSPPASAAWSWAR
jgi:short-subunit dehydrogenase